MTRAENCGAMEKALQNPLILQKVLKNLSSPDLLDCRLVNRLSWFNLATEILIEKEIKIELNLSAAFTSMHFSHAFENPSENQWSLKSLVKILKESHFFPCFRFRFSEGYFEDEHLQEFFSVYGEFVIELEIDLLTSTNVNSAIENFGEILWKKLVNLEKLTLWKVSLGWNFSQRLFSKQLRPEAKLEKLKYLNFEESVGKGEFKFIQDIQNAAPNLQQQNVREVSFVDAEITGSCSHLIWGDKKVLSLIFSPEKSNIGFYQRILRTKEKFRKIIINLEKVRNRPELLSRVAIILTEILKASQSTLSNLDGVMEILSLTEIQRSLFKFPGVEFLTLKPPKSCPEEKEEEENVVACSLLNSDLKSTWEICSSFPSLSQISFDSLDFLENCLESFETVKTLKSDAAFSCAGDFQKLAKTFPMLEKLELKSVQNFEECSHALCENFGKVRNLQIGISVENSNSDSNLEAVSIDTAFLNMRRTSSLLDLKDLKTLHLTFIRNPKNSGTGFGSGSQNDSGTGKWTRCNFLKSLALQFASQNNNPLSSIHLVVCARKADSKDKAEIRKQLQDLTPFVALEICS